MFLSDQQKSKLLRVLTTRLRVAPAVAADYVGEISKSFSVRLGPLELKIAEALAAQKPPKFGWTNVPMSPGSILVEAGTGVMVLGANRQPIRRPQAVHPANFGLLIAENAKPRLEDFEKPIPFMYLDTKGNVTVGIGHKVKGLGDAQRLRFVFKEKHEKAGQAAGPEDIKRDYDLVRGVTGGNFKADFFKKTTDLRLVDSAMSKLFAEDFKSHFADAKRNFRMAQFPRSVQLGVFDLVFPVGMTRLKRKFVKFQAALTRGDWPRAAKESQITKGAFDPRRNNTRFDLIAKGVEMAPFFTTDPKKSSSLADFFLKL